MTTPKDNIKKDKKNTGLMKSLSDKVNFPIIGLGASAGGLEAFELFFRNVPAAILSGNGSDGTQGLI